MEQTNSAVSDLACDRPTARYPQGRRGTRAGYQAHGKLREPACAECQAAHVEACQARWQGLSPEQRDEVRLANREARAKYMDRSPERVETARVKYRRTNRGIIRDAKSKPCADCGVTYPYYVMQFDHIGGKDFNIGQIGPTGSRTKLFAEIAKCEVVCANCHAERSYQRLLEQGRIVI